MLYRHSGDYVHVHVLLLVESAAGKLGVIQAEMLPGRLQGCPLLHCTFPGVGVHNGHLEC